MESNECRAVLKQAMAADAALMRAGAGRLQAEAAKLDHLCQDEPTTRAAKARYALRTKQLEAAAAQADVVIAEAEVMAADADEAAEAHKLEHQREVTDMVLAFLGPDFVGAADGVITAFLGGVGPRAFNRRGSENDPRFRQFADMAGRDDLIDHVPGWPT